MSPPPKPSRDTVREHRQRLRAQGMRPIQIWVPDVRSPAFPTAAREQSLAVSMSPQEVEDQAFIDNVADGSERKSKRSATNE